MQNRTPGSDRKLAALMCAALMAAGCPKQPRVVMMPLEPLEEPTPTGPEVPSPVDLEVHERRAPEPALDITMTNHSDQTLTLQNDFLPWNLGLVLVAVGAVDGTRVDRVFRCGFAAGQERIELRPGEKLSGTLKLSNELSELSEARARGEVIVKWRYRFPGRAGAVPFARVSGTLVLPRTGEPPGREKE